MRRLLFIALLLITAPLARAQCSATTQAQLQTCLTGATAGEVINVSSMTINTTVTGSVPVIITGATTVTGSGDPFGGTSGVLTATDSTNLTFASGGSLQLSGCTNTSALPVPNTYTEITGITLLMSAANSSGAIQFNGTHGNFCFYFYRNHVSTAFTVPLEVSSTNGLLADNLYVDTAGSTGPLFNLLNGDFSTLGYQNWIDATTFGSNQAYYLEANQFVCTGDPTPYGAYDSHAGGKIVFRFNNLSGCPIGVTHGTDSGEFRSAVYNEQYGNTIDNPPTLSQAIFDIRGGTWLFGLNTVKKTNGNNWIALDLSYYRITGQSNSAAWGSALIGLNWTPISATDTNQLAGVVTLNAPAWQANHTYTCSASVPCEIGPTSNNAGTTTTGAGGYNFISTANCTSGAVQPNPWNQTFPGGTQSDGTCTWTNVGGGTTASVQATGGFLSTASDTACISGGTCIYFLDSLGGSAGTYPFRDQPGRGHNQGLYPVYAFNNAGAGLPSPVIVPDSGLTSAVVANRDYYNPAASFTGANGTGSGTLAARPATCTTGVAYWATDQGSWNTSGNGAGNGVLYQCSSTNTWTAYFTPYAYPDPLQGSVVIPASAIGAAFSGAKFQ